MGKAILSDFYLLEIQDLLAIHVEDIIYFIEKIS